MRLACYWLALFCLLGGGTVARGACIVSVVSLSFPYVPSSGTATNRSSTVTVTCTALSGLGGYTITLNAGGGGTFANRRMVGPGFNLAYQLYSNGSYTTVWGDGTSGTSSVSAPVSVTPVLGGTDTYTVYSQVAAQINVGPGTYVDTVTATLTY